MTWYGWGLYGLSPFKEKPPERPPQARLIAVRLCMAASRSSAWFSELQCFVGRGGKAHSLVVDVVGESTECGREEVQRCAGLAVQFERHPPALWTPASANTLVTFGIADFRQLVEHVSEVAAQTDKGLLLVESARDFLRAGKVALPGVSVIERACAQALTNGEQKHLRHTA